jgi:hypothetical protein
MGRNIHLYFTDSLAHMHVHEAKGMRVVIREVRFGSRKGWGAMWPDVEVKMSKVPDLWKYRGS